MKRALYNEVQRPQIHYSPRQNWMNDPNGCVYYKGVYHLYYQYYPFGSQWGPMHWGHAESRDLIHWEEKKIALYPHPVFGMAFSGSTIVDREDCSGLFEAEAQKGGLIAFYTGHQPANEMLGLSQSQHQCAAISLDDGKSFTPIGQNPVIPSEKRSDFRDPKVFRHEATQAWIMIVAAKDHLELYRSQNLLDWVMTQAFSIDNISSELIYECPDLIHFTAENSQVDDIWMISLSLLNLENTAPGTTICTFGDFDGYTFTQKQPYSVIDQGFDFYAMQSWSSLPSAANIWIGWVNHWKYANTIPTTPWRGCMSIPRELDALKTADGRYLLKQLPLQSLSCLEQTSEKLKTVTEIGAKDEVTVFFDGCSAYEIAFGNINAESGLLSLAWSNSQFEQIQLFIDLHNKSITFDRSGSPANSFCPEFEPRVTSEIPLTKTPLDVLILFDRSVIEIFVAGGIFVMTNIFFTAYPLDTFTVTGAARLTDEIVLTPLRSIWH